jgi:hypothetical protein
MGNLWLMVLEKNLLIQTNQEKLLKTRTI